MCEGLRKAWQDPEVRRLHSEVVREALRDPEVRRRISEGTRKAGQDPELRLLRAEIQREAWRDPVKRELRSMAISKALQEPGARERQRKGINRRYDLVALARAASEETGLPMSDVLAMFAEMILMRKESDHRERIEPEIRHALRQEGLSAQPR
jgi:hypothetical protein